MRQLYFLVPRTGLHVGGLIAQLKTLEVAQSICSSDVVTYERREENTLYLDDILSHNSSDNSIFVVGWGPHVPKLLEQLANQNVVYIAYSTGWGFRMPSNVPIIAGSRHTQAYWGKYAPNSLIYYLPSIISDPFKNLQKDRNIDILVQKRKSSQYLLEELVPQLQPLFSVKVLEKWVDNLAEVFNQSKVFLYDSTEHWSKIKASEGFGLPPLEALSCGCTVFSSINDGLSDYLDPGFNCYKLRVYSKQYDIERIGQAVKEWGSSDPDSDPAFLYRKTNVQKRLTVILSEINVFFEHIREYPSDIKDFPTSNINNNWRNRALRKIKHSVASSIKKVIK